MKRNYKKEVFVSVATLLLTFSFASFLRAPVKASGSIMVTTESDRVNIENSLMHINITTTGARAMEWTIKQSGLELAADVGYSGPGRRYPLWDWIPSQHPEGNGRPGWPGELWTGTYNYRMVEVTETRAVVAFNHTCTQAPIVGLNVTKVFEFYPDKYYFNLTVILSNPTDSSMSTLCGWPDTVGYGINPVVYAEPTSSLRQAYKYGDTVELDLTEVYSRFHRDNVEWTAAYSTETGEIVGISTENVTDGMSVALELQDYGAESRIELTPTTIDPEKTINYLFKVYGGPQDHTQLSEVGMDALATQWCYLTDVTGYKDAGDAVLFNCTPSSGSFTPVVKITFASPSVFRLQMSPDGSVPKGTGEALYSLNETTDFITLTTSNLTVEIRRSPWRLSVYDATGTALICEETPNNGSEERSLSYLASDNTVHKVSESMFMGPDEHFYGFGERFNTLDKRGLTSLMQVKDPYGSTGDDTYLPVPFFISTRRYGVYLNSTYKSTFDMGFTENDKYSITVPTSSLDLYFIYGLGNLKEIIRSYTSLTGRAPLPSKWVFYPWMSKNSYDNQEIVMNTVATTRALDIPAGAIVIEGIGKFGRSWDSGRFPDPKGMIDYCHSQGVKVIIWDVPVVATWDPDYSVGESNGYFVKNADGTVYLIPSGYWMSGCAVVDYTNPNATSWWNGLHQFLINDGVDGFKTDGGEHIHDDTVVFYDGSRGSEMENKYAQLWNKAMFTYVMEQTGGEGIIWSRSGFAGSQQFPCTWAGDQLCDFLHLQCVIRAGQSAGISGIPFWASDIGGYDSKPDKNLYIRWAQFGAFSPLMQYHGRDYHDPWTFDQETQDIYKFYASLRMNLIPYIYSYAKITSDTGLPIMRPLLLNYPDDPNTYSVEYEYFFGDEILVAPIYEDVTSRPIYLPEGTWIDFWDDTQTVGPTTINSYPAPLSKLPLFIKAGAIMPMNLNENYTIGGSITNFSQLVFDIYPHNTSQFSYYDDENNATRLIECFKERDQVQIQVSAWNKNYTMRIYADVLPTLVSQDGENLTQYMDFENFKNCSEGWWYDNSSNRVLIRLQQEGAATQVTVTVPAQFTLSTLYAVNLYVNGTFTHGASLRVKFYSYPGAYQGEVTVWNDTTPTTVTLSKNVTHPLGLPVEIATLLLTDEEGNAISTITTFIVRRSHLMTRLGELDTAWLYALSSERPGIFLEIVAIDLQWPYAPS